MALAKMELQLEKYLELATKNEDLKSEERLLSTQLNNIKKMKSLLLEREQEFCLEDQNMSEPRTSYPSAIKDSLRKRCFNIIDHLVHYKCFIECLATDVLNLDCNLIDDDEYLRLSLSFRQAELAILQAIKLNQQRNEVFLQMHDEDSRARLAEVEASWRHEHGGRRELMNRLMLDHKQFLIEKMTRNLEHQQQLLNQRYESISNLIRTSGRTGVWP